jgi:tetratricopeptide (TPR) repeat protein
MSMAYAVPRAGGDEVAEDIATASSIRRYEERLSKDPGSLAFAPLADLYRKAGRPREAIMLCREGLARFPAYGTARLILAKSLAADGDSDGALAEIRLILDASPADAPAHRLAGELHRRAGRLAEALSHLRQAVALDPADRESRVMLEVLDGAGASSEGSALRRLLAEETFVTPSFGDVCLAQGLADEAAQIFVRLLRKDPGDTRAQERLDAALRVKTQRRKGP